jgi:hypothetical protein
MPAGLTGQSSQDFAGGPSALRILHLGVRNTVGELADDGFTQTNPSVVTASASTTLTGITKRGVLGGTVAITRPDKGNGKIGGAPSSPVAGNKPVGIFINDALGNPYENTPAAASGKCPYVSAQGTYGSRLYETTQQTTAGGGSVGTALTAYATGQDLYCSVNGLLTNRSDDSIEVSASGSAKALGVVISAPTSTFPEMIFNLLL